MDNNEGGRVRATDDDNKGGCGQPQPCSEGDQSLDSEEVA